MPAPRPQKEPQNEHVNVTLSLDAQVYQTFLQKAEKAGIEIEPFLSSTLSIVLGCRVFNETSACTPQVAVVVHSLGETKKLL